MEPQILLYEGVPDNTFNFYRSPFAVGWPIVVNTLTGVPYYFQRNVGFTAFATGGGGGASWTEIEVDFGSQPVYAAEFSITDAAISSTSKVQVMPCAKAATGRTADDWAWDGATFAALPGSGSATCYAHFLPGPIVGKRKIQYSVGA